MMQLGAMVNLVVCQKSKVNDWVEHFKENYEYEAYFYDLTNKKDFEQFIWESSQELYEHVVGVINYELAWRRPELLKLKDFTLMLDESSLIQNKKAKQTKFVLKLKPDNVILLSGTPCSGKYENLWTQAHLLGWDISEDLYNKQYVNKVFAVDSRGNKVRNMTTGKLVMVVDKKNPYKNVERLKSKLREYGSVFMKTEDVFDLPEQTFIDVMVDNSKEYKHFMKHGIVNFSISETEFVELVGDTSLTKQLYARQLCGIYSQSKLNAFEDILNSTNDRLIVFYNFKLEVEALKRICELAQRPYSLVNGTIKDLDAYETESDSVTFIQYQSGSKGLNLQKANKIIYYSPTVRCDDWMQSKKRIHRIGQEQPCFYYKMIVKGSVEEQIYDALLKGVDYTDELFKEKN